MGRPKAEEKTFTAPTARKSDIVKALETLAPTVNKGQPGDVDRKISDNLESKLIALLNAVAPAAIKDDELAEKMYQKLLKNPFSRCKLEHIHTARAFKYGHAQFGPTYWYKEGPNLAKKLKNQSDRRKFRQGLRSDVDFVNQLNLINLDSLMADGDPEKLPIVKIDDPVRPSELFECLRTAPPLKILELFNEQKAQNIKNSLDAISGVMHFGQSMAAYFAQDDALEPALAAVCEVLRSDPNIGSVLKKRCSTFMAVAQCYQKQRSPQDVDLSTTPHSQQNSHQNNRVTPRRPSSRYARGLCFAFQNRGCPRGRSCNFTHKCNRCGSFEHGASACSSG